ncbi:hypothetical protein ACWC9Q_10605 [Streptomyces sp. NPDC001142]
MKSTKLERRAQKLQLATGIEWSDALKRVRKIAPSAPVIPEARRSQAVLENQFLTRFAWPSTDPRNPWGISSTICEPDSLTLTIEEQNGEAGDDEESVTQNIVREVVPRYDEYGEVHGVPGLRFVTEPSGITIRRIGVPGSITLVGIDPEDWCTAIDLERRSEKDDELFLCHDRSPEQWHPTERPYRDSKTDTRLSRYHRGRDSSAWLASGLLRRVPLLRTVGVPLSTTSWTNPADDGGRTWIIDFIHAPKEPAPLHHRGYINLLTDPDCGLPIRCTSLQCSCAVSPRPSWDCRFNAVSTTGDLGALQVRFTSRVGAGLDRYLELLDDYEERQQLYRRMPAHLLRPSARETAS